jgi:hypothetical protein
VHPKVQGLSSHEIAYAFGLWYLHSLPHARGATARHEDLVKVHDFKKLTSNIPIRFDSSSYIVDEAASAP